MARDRSKLEGAHCQNKLYVEEIWLQIGCNSQISKICCGPTFIHAIHRYKVGLKKVLVWIRGMPNIVWFDVCSHQLLISLENQLSHHLKKKKSSVADFFGFQIVLINCFTQGQSACTNIQFNDFFFLLILSPTRHQILDDLFAVKVPFSVIQKHSAFLIGRLAWLKKQNLLKKIELGSW